MPVLWLKGRQNKYVMCATTRNIYGDPWGFHGVKSLCTCDF